MLTGVVYDVTVGGTYEVLKLVMAANLLKSAPNEVSRKTQCLR